MKSFLREVGIQEWILDGDGEFKDFISFFTNNITYDNILSEEEMVEWVIACSNAVHDIKSFVYNCRRYNELVKVSQTMSDTQLNDEKDAIAKMYDGIWDIVDGDIHDLEYELEMLSLTEEHYDDLMVQMK